MPELRWNPLLRTYTMVAANRQHRPQMPSDWCPFCKGSPSVPENYSVYAYPNDFPVLSPAYDAEQQEVAEHLYHIAPAYGHCEVILYSPDHNAKLYELSLDHLTELVQLWQQRHNALTADKRIKYVFVFENRGEEVGVTMPHPHGQIYGYSFVPLKIKTELDSSAQYHAEHSCCLLCDLQRTEMEQKVRLITQNNSFVAYIPHFTDYPFGVFISSRQHLGTFAEFSPQHCKDLADILRNITGAFDQLYDRPFPYMMCIHQTPVNAHADYPNADQYYHFHIEFYPPLRDRHKIKWYASSEMGAWAAANVVEVETSADMLRQALARFQNR
ncbi:MAG: galactose-1-phosphate uridylyltransferase [Chitinophagales bacterium]|jgi:UDPglucose--hexose-1-phosphate uridylyltransferase|nr:galactose-1-phosphate uridylyltransferase [Chitinophagales bacterium]